MGGGGDERAPLGAADADVERAAGGRARGEPEYADAGFLDIFKNFALLGWTAFGGPAAHIGLFQKVGASARARACVRACVRVPCVCVRARALARACA